MKKILFMLAFLLFVIMNISADENLENNNLAETIGNSIFPIMDLLILQRPGGGFESTSGEYYDRRSPELAELMTMVPSANTEYQLYLKRHNRAVIFNVIGGVRIGSGLGMYTVSVANSLIIFGTDTDYIIMGTGAILSVVGIPFVIIGIVNGTRSRRNLTFAIENYNHYVKELIGNNCN